MNWLKSFGWVKTLGLVLGAVLLAMAAGQAASKMKSARKKEATAQDKLSSGVSSEIHKGKVLVDSANKDKDKAVAARERMEAQLEKLGEASEDMDSIADRFNSRRLRKSTSDSTT